MSEVDRAAGEGLALPAKKPVTKSANETPLYFVYVLHNAAGTLYTGIAKDVLVRLGQHNSGGGARFTRGRGPWRVCHREGPFRHGDALRREAAIKSDRKFKAVLRVRLAAVAVQDTKAARSRTARAARSGPAIKGKKR